MGFQRIALAVHYDRSDRLYLYVWRVLLWIQLVLYTIAVGRFIVEPAYRKIAHPDYPHLYENHIGNYVSLTTPLNVPLMTVHVAMAWWWIAAVLLQKFLVKRMSIALAGPRDTSWLRYREAHMLIGWSHIVLGLLGVLVAPLLSFWHHGNPGQKWFLLGQPLIFVPAIAMTLWTARRRDGSIWDHRFWAETAFLGPAVASLWTEVAIHFLGRIESIGPHRAELGSSIVGGLLGFAVVVIPAAIARREGKRAESMARDTSRHA
jgi:hypothetical protein